INTFISTQTVGSIGLGFAIPINLARRVIDEVQRYGRIRAAWPGMQLQLVSPELAQHLGWRDAVGLAVNRVEPGGPAERAGVKVGDELRDVNGQRVGTIDDAKRSIYGAWVGDRMRLGIERAG